MTTFAVKPEATFSVMTIGESPTLLRPFEKIPHIHQTRLSGLDVSHAKIIVFLLPQKNLLLDQVANIYLRKERIECVDDEESNWELREIITHNKRSVEIGVIGRTTVLIRTVVSVQGLHETPISPMYDRISKHVEEICVLGR
jgi:hypothetical protein